MAKKIGFIGAGNMGGALITAACKSIDPKEVIITDFFPDKAKELAAQVGCALAADNAELAAEAEYIVLAVKPNVIRKVVKDVAPVIAEQLQAGRSRVLVTIAAGVTVAAIKECLGDVDVPVIRIMPNMPAMVGEGMILLTSSAQKPDDVSEEQFAQLQAMLAKAGAFERVSEPAVDCCTSVSSCSPAFVFMFIEAMADGAVQMGIPRDQAMRLAAKAVQGAAAMVLGTGSHPGALKDAVCSPGGSTIVGVTTLEEYNFRSAVIQAVIHSAEKNLSLGK